MEKNQRCGYSGYEPTEFFFNAGRGFHSNDARGATITVDPVDRVSPADRVDPLVDASSLDVGVRTAVLPNVQVSMSLWSLELDSELLFVGDAGTTEASRASKRRGIELSAISRPVAWLLLDADLAWSRSRFTGFDPAGDRIPGAVENVASVGVAIDHPSGWFGGARFRHFGGAPLIEDNSVRSQPTTLVNMEAGFRFSERYKLSAAVHNVFDSGGNDITYLYESQLAGETQPVAESIFTRVPPRQALGCDGSCDRGVWLRALICPTLEPQQEYCTKFSVTGVHCRFVSMPARRGCASAAGRPGPTGRTTSACRRLASQARSRHTTVKIVRDFLTQ